MNVIIVIRRPFLLSLWFFWLVNYLKVLKYFSLPCDCFLLMILFSLDAFLNLDHDCSLYSRCLITRWHLALIFDSPDYLSMHPTYVFDISRNLLKALRIVLEHLNTHGKHEVCKALHVSGNIKVVRILIMGNCLFIKGIEAMGVKKTLKGCNCLSEFLLKGT